MKLYNRKPNNEIQWVIILFTVLEITSRINSDRGYWYQYPWDHRIIVWNQHKPSAFRIKGTTNGLDYNWLVYSGIPPTLGPPASWDVSHPPIGFFLTPKICSEEVGSHLRGTSQRCRQTVWPQDLKWGGNGSTWPRIDGLIPNMTKTLTHTVLDDWSKVSSFHPSSPIRCDCFLMASWGDVWVVESPFILGTLWYSNMANWEIHGNPL